jgi:hypothetical protein
VTADGSLATRAAVVVWQAALPLAMTATRTIIRPLGKIRDLGIGRASGVVHASTWHSPTVGSRPADAIARVTGFDDPATLSSMAARVERP